MLDRKPKVMYSKYFQINQITIPMEAVPTACVYRHLNQIPIQMRVTRTTTVYVYVWAITPTHLSSTDESSKKNQEKENVAAERQNASVEARHLPSQQIYIAVWQSSRADFLRQNLPKGSIMSEWDFAENYAFWHSVEIQQEYW